MKEVLEQLINEIRNYKVRYQTFNEDIMHELFLREELDQLLTKEVRWKSS